MVPEANQEHPVEPQRLDSADPEADIAGDPPHEADIADDSPPESNSSDGIDLKNLRAAFRKLEESKIRFVGHIREIRRVSSDNVSIRTQVERELKDTQGRLTESNTQLNAIKREVSSLKAELNTANGLLEEIDKTLT